VLGLLLTEPMQTIGGIIDEAKDMGDSVKNMTGSNNQDLKELINTEDDES